MPSSQIPASNLTMQQTTGVANKPPPSKSPPPPPPPPKHVRPQPPAPPPPPPPPPPRNSSQMSYQSSLTANQLCGAPSSGAALSLNNGSSMNSLNSAGRCSNHPFSGQPYSSSNNHLQRGFTRHTECGSRSSVSSHGSSAHHHHGHTINSSGNSSINPFGQTGSSTCSHQPNCAAWSAQHNHPNSSSMSDNGSCNGSYNLDGNIRTSCQSARGGCCNSHHLHAPALPTPPSRCPSQCPSSVVRNNGTNGAVNSLPTTMSNRNISYFATPDNVGPSVLPSSNVCCDVENRGSYLAGASQHHNHHAHNLHNIQLSSSSSLSSLPPVDPHRYNMASQPDLISNGQMQRPMASANGHQTCNHTHRPNGCAHHHQPGCINHSLSSSIQQPQQPIHACGGCSHSHNDQGHHQCNMSPIPPTHKCCGTTTLHHGCQHETNHVNNRTSDLTSNNSNELLISTIHNHNLSNSSTTTHTSNVAVKHQPQFHQPFSSRGGRSSSSQQYEHYGLSSAASTSSATASLSSYQPASYDDLVPLYPSSKIHQPLPPLPTSVQPPTKSQPASPAHQMFVTNNGGNYPVHPMHYQPNQSNHQHTQAQHPPPPPPPPPPLPPSHHQQVQNFHQSQLPPLPPRPSSPNASSCSTQITTVRTSPSLQNLPVTRVTSQAGVQNPLPSSDIPPPLPPLNPGSRPAQLPLVNSTMTRIQNIANGNPSSNTNMTTNLNLNYSRGGIVTDAERKTEALTRQVELELNQQHQQQQQQRNTSNEMLNGGGHGLCQKCGQRILASQEACKAMNNIYHANCFVCCVCGRTLINKDFYPVGDKVYCKEDFKYIGQMQTLEKCAECLQPISNLIIRGPDKSYHPKCFKCCICGKCLDGVPFTIDGRNKIYCVDDYHDLYSPKCARCGKSISPIDGTDETVRVVSMDKDYHIDCYCCEDCGLQLTDEEPSRSYPLDNHLLCQQCHINRLSEKQAALSLRS